VACSIAPQHLGFLVLLVIYAGRARLLGCSAAADLSRHQLPALGHMHWVSHARVHPLHGLWPHLPVTAQCPGALANVCRQFT
jgi:hypothetical protein